MTEQTPAEASLPTSMPDRSARLRSIASAVLLVAGLVLAPLAVVAAEARATLIGTDRFVAAFGPLAADPAVQSALADVAIAALGETVRFDELAGSAIDSVVDRLDLSPIAGQALDRLREPTAAALRSAVEGAIRSIVASDRFATIWQSMLREAHVRTVAALERDPGAVVAVDEYAVTLRLGPVVDGARQRLLDQGIRAAALIPQIDRSVVIAQLPELRLAILGYRTVGVFGTWAPWLAGALLAGALCLAPARRSTLVRAGAGLAVGMSVLLVAVTVARANLNHLGGAPATYARTTLRRALFEAATSTVITVTVTLLAIGAVVALVAWLSPRAARPWRLG